MERQWCQLSLFWLLREMPRGCTVCGKVTWERRQRGNGSLNVLLLLQMGQGGLSLGLCLQKTGGFIITILC